MVVVVVRVTFKHHKLRHHVAWVGRNCGVLFVRRRVRIGEPRVVEFIMMGVGVLKSSKVSVAVGVVDIRFRFGLREFVIAVAVGVVARAVIRAHF